MMEELERAAAANLSDFALAFREVAPSLEAVSQPCAGGVAAFTGAGSPLTTIKGAGPEITEDDLRAAESLLKGRGATIVTIEAAPWLTAETVQRLHRLGYRETGAEHVLVREIPFDSPPPDLTVSLAEAQEWSEVMRESFELPDESLWHALCRAAACLPGAVNLGIRGEDQRWIACAQMVAIGRTVIFGCDGTIPLARGRGAQISLIRERLRRATAPGLATAEVAPNSGSERNYRTPDLVP